MDKIKELYQKYKEIVNYLFFGVATTIVNWVTYAILVKGLSMNETIGNVIAVIAAVLFAFFTNRKWVFESDKTGFKSLVKEAISFFGSRAVTMVIEMAGVPALQSMGLNQSLFGVKGMWSKIAISVIVVILNYIFSKFIVFRKTKEVERPVPEVGEDKAEEASK